MDKTVQIFDIITVELKGDKLIDHTGIYFEGDLFEVFKLKKIYNFTNQFDYYSDESKFLTEIITIDFKDVNKIFKPI